MIMFKQDFHKCVKVPQVPQGRPSEDGQRSHHYRKVSQDLNGVLSDAKSLSFFHFFTLPQTKRCLDVLSDGHNDDRL